MSENPTAKLSREQLYNEIWEIAATGVAQKYNLTYARLLKLCKENDIPIPPSGYWTKVRLGKPVTKPQLPESSINEVSLQAPERVKRTPASDAISKTKASKKTEVTAKQPKVEVSPNTKDDQIPYRTVVGKYNTYNREQLYKEVWEKPVIEVAVKYGVSDVMIHKVCKTLNVPVPPRGYWSRIRAGEKIKKTPLPATKGVTQITGAKNFEGVPVNKTSSPPLTFLPENEREKVLFAAEQIQLPDENAQLHKKITAYRSVVKEWNKNDTKDEGAKRSYNNYSNRPPFLAGVISNETLPRVYRILDALYREIESLGGSVNDNLSLQIRNEHVNLEVVESQDEIEHIITRQEAQEILKYEDAKRHRSWASEPQIRKYDYVFNGRIRISIGQGRYFRDTDRTNIESRLGDMLIALYEESEVVRIDREAREEEARKRKEEERKREERRKLYEIEVERTIALENLALDYEKACRIRAYVKAVEAVLSPNRLDAESEAWLDWAKKKADWFDPTIARNDESFGKRKHKDSEDQKALKRNWRYW